MDPAHRAFLLDDLPVSIRRPRLFQFRGSPGEPNPSDQWASQVPCGSRIRRYLSRPGPYPPLTSPPSAAPTAVLALPSAFDRVGAAKRPLEGGGAASSDAVGSDGGLGFDDFGTKVRRVEAAELQALAAGCFTHPILKLQAELALEAASGQSEMPSDHGSWKGCWPLPSSSTHGVREHCAIPLPCGDESSYEAALAQRTARRELTWSHMDEAKRELYRAAAQKQWQLWLDNQAVRVLSPAETAQKRRELCGRGEEDRVLQLRFVLTDKNDGHRSADRPLPVEASARLVVPGFKDRANLEGELRRDAPTGNRNSQHALFLYAGSHPEWQLCSADVRAAFLKGDPYVSRELYISPPDVRRGPPVPMDSQSIAVVLKGVFGLADAPRERFLRLSRCLKEHGWIPTLIDAAFWVRRCPDGVVTGLIVGHVDDLLFTGDAGARKSLDEIGRELGFGRVEDSDFTWCGKRIRRAEDGTIRVGMKTYHDNLSPVPVPRSRRQVLTAPLTPFELRQFRGLGGSLQWLVAQVRFDLAFMVSALQGELRAPTLGSLLRANALVVEAKRNASFELIFRPVDLAAGGCVVVCDAALGNVRAGGSAEGTPEEKVCSQAGYLVLYGDAELVAGRSGSFVVLDARRHRLQRVCRSSYAAETLGLEEAVDAGQLLRGLIAELRGLPTRSRFASASADSVPCTVVVDAKDTHDRVTSDTSSFGQQKSLAYTVSWLKQQFRRPNLTLRWTATENMICDCLTKPMDTAHLRNTLTRGTWSIVYHPEFIKAKTKAPSARAGRLEATGLNEGLPGEALKPGDEIRTQLERLSGAPGWHLEDGTAIQVARKASSLRTPEPRFAASAFPQRSSFGLFGGERRQLEDKVSYLDFPNARLPLGQTAETLVSFFVPRKA